jgi:hypothetical protein
MNENQGRRPHASSYKLLSSDEQLESCSVKLVARMKKMDNNKMNGHMLHASSQMLLSTDEQLAACGL